MLAPNGSGKSTVITFVKNYKSNNKSIEFGYYINADDIAVSLRDGGFDFSLFDISVTAKEFKKTVFESGLVNTEFNETHFAKCFSIRNNRLKLIEDSVGERMAQIIADFLRKKLLQERKKFSFETVFSHESKLDIMRQAVRAGYKVYLYFVSTESPEVNKFRVLARKEKGGHDVPQDKIVSRYYRSLQLLYEACQLAYQVFFFDNSLDAVDFSMFAHFKKIGDKKVWDKIDDEQVPDWFRKYYLDKIEP